MYDLDKKIYYIAFNMAGLGAFKKKELLDHYKDIKTIFSIDDKELVRLLGIKNSSKAFNKKELLEKAEKEFYETIKLNVGITYIHSNDYPENLLSLPDPPIVLYYKGNLAKSDFNSISVVGCRNATSYGLNNSYRLGYELGQIGITVVSGLAMGIDAEAHKGTLKSNGRTVAVLGCGIDKYFPKANIDLQNIISEKGCIFSEFPIGSYPKSYHFPIRNRIIAGLSVGVVVVEGSKDSGSLYTAQYALDYGREIYAFPGDARSYNYTGTHLLIKKGAKLIENFKDLLEDLSLVLDLDLVSKNKKDFSKLTGNINNKIKNNKIKNETNSNFENSQLTKEEAIILKYLSVTEKKTFDKIVELSKLKVEEVISGLTSLTFKGLCSKLGNCYKRNL